MSGRVFQRHEFESYTANSIFIWTVVEGAASHIRHLKFKLLFKGFPVMFGMLVSNAQPIGCL